MAPPPVPRATCRLQLHAGFTFADAEALVPYLAELGISHLYLSPILKARPGSQHGYDIVDHATLNPELGDRDAFERLAGAAIRAGMGIVLDIVPNHMGVGGSENGLWQDVLEWGEDSPYARFFDIDWQPARREVRGKLLLPFLGDHYGAVLERGELVPRFDRATGEIAVWYGPHCLPLAVRDYAGLVESAVGQLGETPDGDALAGVLVDLHAFSAMGGGRSVEQRRGAGRAAKALLAQAAENPAVRTAIDRVLAELAGRADALHRLLERQAWRLSFWRVAADEINYRRFFDINDLAALRMVEEPELFDLAHALIFELLRAGLVHGLRIDHVDGLFNPADYCRHLQARVGVALGRPVSDPDDRPIWLVVEKILAAHETIRRDWPVAGTTGYDFLNQVAGLFVDGEGEAALTAIHERITGTVMDVDREVYESKKRIIDDHMAGEVRVLAGRLGRIAVSNWRSRDFTLSGLYSALKAVLAGLPVYRTYVTSRRATDSDRRYIAWAVAQARRRAVGDPSAYTFIEGVLDTSAAVTYGRRAVVDFAMRFQQVSGPVMAKGLEDTVLYRCNRLIEVGGDPRRFGLSAAAFHNAMRARQRGHPQAMLATATHDTKRGEDTRLRIAMLSSLGERWGQRLDRWHQLNASFRRMLESGPAPDPNDELFLYQTMIGAWPDEGPDPIFVDRMVAATLKAVREAKRRTSWNAPDEAYEAAVSDFVRRICETGRVNPFLDDFQPFQAHCAVLGMLAGLAQTVLKLTVPGVPDLYQGNELWDLSLVDPDNRRPVDWDLRRRMLGSMEDGPLPADPAHWRSGAVKQEIIRRLLNLRRRDPELFDHGAYRPLTVRGDNTVIAFARQTPERALVVVVPPLAARLWPEGWAMPPLAAEWRGLHVETPRRGSARRWRNVLGGGEITPVLRRGHPVLGGPDLFASFPLAVLEEVAPP
jgi:(1->4)-alpha-D-glucan 1-alpha-D-glucosylmutase